MLVRRLARSSTTTRSRPVKGAPSAPVATGQGRAVGPDRPGARRRPRSARGPTGPGRARRRSPGRFAQAEPSTERSMASGRPHCSFAASPHSPTTTRRDRGDRPQGRRGTRGFQTTTRVGDGEAAGDRQSSAIGHRCGTDMPKRNGPGIELLADPTRRRIIAALAVCPRRPSHLAADLGLSRPAITRQLSLLRQAGLIRLGRSLADGRVRLYGIEPRAHGAITAWLAGTDVGRPLAITIDHDGVVRDG